MAQPPTKNIFLNSLKLALNYFKKPKELGAGLSGPRLIGEDHLGNKYYEEDTPRRPRPVKRFYLRDNLEGVKSFHELANVPPLWDSWLRFKRQEPPTPSEMRDSEEYFRMQQERANSNTNNSDQASYQDPKSRRPSGHVSRVERTN